LGRVFTWWGRWSWFLWKWWQWWEGRWGSFRRREGRWMQEQRTIPSHGTVEAIVELVIFVLLAFFLVPTTTTEWFETKAIFLIGKIKLDWVISCNTTNENYNNMTKFPLKQGNPYSGVL
jgi:hypothetical protein